MVHFKCWVILLFTVVGYNLISSFIQLLGPTDLKSKQFRKMTRLLPSLLDRTWEHDYSFLCKFPRLQNRVQSEPSISFSQTNSSRQCLAMNVSRLIHRYCTAFLLLNAVPGTVDSTWLGHIELEMYTSMGQSNIVLFHLVQKVVECSTKPRTGLKVRQKCIEIKFFPLKCGCPSSKQK